MADDFYFKGLIGFWEALFGSVIGAVIGILIDIALSLLNVGIGNMIKLVIIGVCIVVGMWLFAVHKLIKQATKRA
jgi:ATP/ADP translocase